MLLLLALLSIGYDINSPRIEDDWIIAQGNVSTNEIGIMLRNKRNVLVEVLWNDARFIGPDGRSERIIRSGTYFVEKEKPQTATNLLPYADYCVNLLGADHARWNGTEWVVIPILPDVVRDDDV